jgi:hypothetical protein
VERPPNSGLDVGGQSLGGLMPYLLLSCAAEIIFYLCHNTTSLFSSNQFCCLRGVMFQTSVELDSKGLRSSAVSS